MQARASREVGVSQWAAYKASCPQSSASSAGASVAQEVPVDGHGDFSLDSTHHCPSFSSKRQRTHAGLAAPQGRAMPPCRSPVPPSPVSLSHSEDPSPPSSLPGDRLRQLLLLSHGGLPLPSSRFAAAGAPPSSAGALLGHAVLPGCVPEGGDRDTGAKGAAAAGTGSQGAGGARPAASAPPAASAGAGSPQTCPGMPGADPRDSDSLAAKDGDPSDTKALLARRRRLLEDFHRRAQSELRTPEARSPGGALAAQDMEGDWGEPAGGAGARGSGEGAQGAGGGEGEREQNPSEGKREGKGMVDVVTREQSTQELAGPFGLSSGNAGPMQDETGQGSEPLAGTVKALPQGLAPIPMPQTLASVSISEPRESPPVKFRRCPLPARFGLEEAGDELVSPLVPHMYPLVQPEGGRRSPLEGDPWDHKGVGEAGGRQALSAGRQEAAVRRRQPSFGGLSTGQMLSLDPLYPVASHDSDLTRQGHANEQPHSLGLVAPQPRAPGLGPDITAAQLAQGPEAFSQGNSSPNSRRALPEGLGRPRQPLLPGVGLPGDLPPVPRPPAAMGGLDAWGLSPAPGMGMRAQTQATSGPGLSRLQRAEQLRHSRRPQRASLARSSSCLPLLPAFPEEAELGEPHSVAEPPRYPLYASLSASRASAAAAATAGTAGTLFVSGDRALLTPSLSLGSTDGGPAVSSVSAPLPGGRGTLSGYSLLGPTRGAAAASLLESTPFQAAALLMGSSQLDPALASRLQQLQPPHRQQLQSRLSEQQRQSPLSAQLQQGPLSEQQAAGIGRNVTLRDEIVETRMEIVRLKALLSATGAPLDAPAPQPALWPHPLTPPAPVSSSATAARVVNGTAPLHPLTSPPLASPIPLSSTRPASSSWAGRLAQSSSHSGPGASSGTPLGRFAQHNLAARSMSGGVSVEELLDARDTWSQARGRLHPLSTPGVPTALGGLPPHRKILGNYLSPATASLTESLGERSSLAGADGRGSGAHSPCSGAGGGSSVGLGRPGAPGGVSERAWQMQQQAAPVGSDAGGHKALRAAVLLLAGQERLLKDSAGGAAQGRRASGCGQGMAGEALRVEDYEYETPENKHAVSMLLGQEDNAPRGGL